jgi:Alginate export
LRHQARCSRRGTGVPPTDLHPYPLPTYEEDWRALQTSDRTDVWDLVKSVPLSADGTTSLSLSGELRVTYERFGNQNFGLTPPDPDGYFLQRYLLHTDVHAGPRVRVWTELNSGFENGCIGGPRPVIDEDKLDLHQAFVDVTVGVAASAAVLRVGRQEIALGSGRMYALREGPTVRLPSQEAQPETRARTATMNQRRDPSRRICRTIRPSTCCRANRRCAWAAFPSE